MNAGGGSKDETTVSIARLEIKVDSVIQILEEERDRNKALISDHETRIRYIEKAGNIQEELQSLDKRTFAVEKWVNSVPVGLAIMLIIAAGGLVSWIGGLPV